MRVGVVQMTSTEDVTANLRKVDSLVREAAALGAELIALPENFAYLGPEAQKVELGEVLEDDAQGPILSLLRGLSAELGVYLSAGGMPELSGDDARVFNTHVLMDPSGACIATYRKIHLFDVELAVAGGRGMRESDSVVPGETPAVVQTPWGGLGLTVCYDLRFPELYRSLGRLGARALLVPAAFTLQTGKDHWEVLLRARAIENQCYVVAAAQFGKHSSKRSSWGKSMIVDPWGVVIANVGEHEGVSVAELSSEYVDEVRAAIPALSHRKL